MTVDQFIKRAKKVKGGFRITYNPSYPENERTIRAVEVKDTWGCPACPIAAVYEETFGVKASNSYITAAAKELGLKGLSFSSILDAADGNSQGQTRRKLLKAFGLEVK